MILESGEHCDMEAMISTKFPNMMSPIGFTGMLVLAIDREYL